MRKINIVKPLLKISKGLSYFQTGSKQIIKLIFLCFLFEILFASAQVPAKLIIKDETGNAMVGVSVTYRNSVNGKPESNIQYCITDINGVALMQITGNERLECSYVGYEYFAVNIAPGEIKEVIMNKIINDLHQVVITGQMNETQLGQSAESVKIIEAKTIEQSSIKNLQDLLQTQLNINITEDHILGSNIMMNGLGGENIKILIDGIPIIGRENGNIDLSQVLMNNVERVEIIQGPMSVLYSSNASAGVINIITKKQSDKKILFTLNNELESPGSFQSDALFFYRLKFSHLSISGGRNYFDGYPEFNSSRTQTWKPNIKYFGAFDYGMKFKNYSNELNLSYFHQTTLNRGMPVITPYEAYAFDEKYYTTRYDASLVQDRLINKTNHLNLTASFNNYSRSRESFRKDLVLLDNVSLNSNGTADTSSFNQYLIRGLFINAASQHKFKYQIGSEYIYENGKGKKLKAGNNSITEAAAFMQAEWKLTESFLLKPGIRLNYNSIYQTLVIPSLNLKYNLNTNLILRAAVARGYRTPSLKELNLNFVDVNHNIHGNADLNPEKSWSLNSDILLKRKIYNINIELEPALFYNYINQQIILALNDTGNNLYTYQNLDITQTYGGTLNINFNSKNTSLQIGYGLTGTDAKIKIGFDKVSWSPQFTMNFGYEIEKTKTHLSILFKNVGVTPLYISDAAGLINKYNSEAYNLLDIILSQKLFKGFICVNAGVKNILNVTEINSGLLSGGFHSDGANISIARGRYYTASLQINLSVKNKSGGRKTIKEK